MASISDLTPNQINDISTRIQHAKEFLHENPTEKALTAARIYNLHPTTLNSSIKRAPTSGIHGGHNRIMQEHHIEALHLFIRSLLAYGI
jgi:hypothetical protein